MKAHRIVTHSSCRIQVTLNYQANVLLVDSLSYRHFKNRQRFSYNGGWYTRSPIILSIPNAGTWYVLVGSPNSSIRYSITIL